MGNQASAANAFFWHGRSHFTRTGFLAKSEAAPTRERFESLKNVDLTDRVYLVTGANSGCGKEVCRYLIEKNASVYMLCRNRDRAEAAKAEIVNSVPTEYCENRLHILAPYDCSVGSEVRRAWDSFSKQESRLDGLLCNAGILSNELRYTRKGDELTFATHFIYGTYLLGKLALPMLKKTNSEADTLKNCVGSKMVMMSSGGMLCTPFLPWRKIVTDTAS